MPRKSIILLWLLSVIARPASAGPIGGLRVAGPAAAAAAEQCGQQLSRHGAHKSSARAGAPGAAAVPVRITPAGLVLMWRLGESSSGGAARAPRVQRRRSVTEKQLMNDKAHTMYARQRLLWLKSVMGHLNTARRDSPAGLMAHSEMGAAIGLDQMTPSSSSSSWENMLGAEESPVFDETRGDDGGSSNSST